MMIKRTIILSLLILFLSSSLWAKDKNKGEDIYIQKGWVGFLKMPKVHDVEKSENLREKKAVLWKHWEAEKKTKMKWLPKPDPGRKKLDKKSPWPPFVAKHRSKKFLESLSRKTKSRKLD